MLVMHLLLVPTLQEEKGKKEREEIREEIRNCLQVHILVVQQ
jgi:hypothetical protein